jgi:hypothetical protein
MNLGEYIAARGRGTPALTYAEAKIAGIGYPLTKNWFKLNLLKDVDGEAMHAARMTRVADVKAKKETKIALYDAGPKTPKEPKKIREAKRVVAKALKTLGLTLATQVSPPLRIVRAPRSPEADVSAYVNSAAFLASFEWKRLRVKAFEKYGRICLCCGASPATGAVLNIDHVKSRRRRPDLALELNNLQVLCGDCNHGKGNDEIDYRKA